MHNLFGDTHSINIKLDGHGYHFSEALEGEHVGDMLDYVHINVDELKRAYRDKLLQCDIPDQQRHLYLQELIAGLTTYTYLEK